MKKSNNVTDLHSTQQNETYSPNVAFLDLFKDYDVIEGDNTAAYDWGDQGILVGKEML